MNVTLTDGKEYLAWFPNVSDCFPHHDQWYGVGLAGFKYSFRNEIGFMFNTGTCRRSCDMKTISQDILECGVVAHGPSRWLLQQLPDESCGYVDWPREWSLNAAPNCKKLPHAFTTPEPPTTITTTMVIYIVVSVVVTSVVLTTVVQAVMKFICRTNQQDQQPATSSPATAPPQPVNTQGNIELAELPVLRHPPTRMPESQTYDSFYIYDDVFLPGHQVSPQVPQSRRYDHVQLYDDVAEPGHQVSPQVPESRRYENVQLYEDVAEPGEHTQAPTVSQEPVYLEVV